MDMIGHLIAAAAASPWALAAVALLLIIDGFFPFVPGETLVVATAAAAGVAGGNPWLVVAVAIPAALAGDLIAYCVGRRLGLERRVAKRDGRIARAFRQAQRRLATNPASILLTAKFVPVLRVAVSMAAGSMRMPLRRYLPLAVASISLYTGLHVAVGALVGTAAGGILGNPLVALGVSLAVGLGIGLLVDTVVKRWSARAERRRAARAPRDGQGRAATVHQDRAATIHAGKERAFPRLLSPREGSPREETGPVCRVVPNVG
jgi:membrane protein DedA with SNARE-associated domain